LLWRRGAEGQGSVAPWRSDLRAWLDQSLSFSRQTGIEAGLVLGRLSDSARKAHFWAGEPSFVC
jgi:hypothetical protein